MDTGQAAPVIHRYGTDPAQFGELWRPGRPAAGTVVVIHAGGDARLVELSGDHFTLIDPASADWAAAVAALPALLRN